MPRAMEFGLLGPLVVRNGEMDVPVPRGHQRALLAILLLNANRLVPVEAITEALWASAPPRSAPVAVRSYIRWLRLALGPAGRERISTQPRGYLIRVAEGELDLARFEHLLAAARAAAHNGLWDQAAGQARDALSNWRGEPLADIESDTLALREVPRLAELRLQAMEIRINADLCQGGHAGVTAELQHLCAVHPLREHLHALLMLALYRSGRQAEALAAYEHLRTMLVEELGADPGPELQTLHRQILGADPALAAPQPQTGALPGAAARVEPGAPTGTTPIVPRQLPATMTHFTGRAAELDALAQMLPQAGGDPPGAVVISALDGMAGVGKTALAMHWAHQVAPRFGDGQLYVNLRGFDPADAPTEPGEALRGFLEALGVAPEQIPPSADARASLFRSLLADKKMLIVLDNACDEQQVRPMLPASPGCLVLITSRRQLAGLAAADGARLLTLDLPSYAEARHMLTARLGAERAAAEPDAVNQMASLCARLPLALAVAAARASTRPRFTLTALASELSDSASRLDALDAGDPAASVRAVFSWSYQQLSPQAARMFRLLGHHPGPDISVPAAASLTATDQTAATRALRELTVASLLTEHSPGRYAFHDLLRTYATELAQTTDDEHARRAVTDRMLDHYLHTATAASQRLHEYRELESLSDPQPGVRPEEMASLPQALEWFRAERRVLIAVISQAASDGSQIHAWQLPWAMAPFLYGQGSWHELEATQQIALTAARRLGNVTAQAHAHHFLGSAYSALGAHQNAMEQLTTALSLDRQSGAVSLQARDHNTLVVTCIQQGRFRDALSHAQEALRLCRDLEHQYGQAHSLNSVGWCHAQLGNFQEALACCREALVIYRGLRPRLVSGEADTLDSLGYAHHHLGRYAEAIACYQQAIDLLGDTGDPDHLAEFLIHLGDAYHSAGDREAARRAWQQGLAVRDDLQQPAADQLRSRLARNPATHDPAAGGARRQGSRLT